MGWKSTTRSCSSRSQEWLKRYFPYSLRLHYFSSGCFDSIFTLSFSTFNTVQRPEARVLKCRNLIFLPRSTLQRWHILGKEASRRDKRLSQQSPRAFGRTADPKAHGYVGVISVGHLTFRCSLCLWPVYNPKTFEEHQKRTEIWISLLFVSSSNYCNQKVWYFFWEPCELCCLQWFHGLWACLRFCLSAEPEAHWLPQLEAPVSVAQTCLC